MAQAQIYWKKAQVAVIEETSQDTYLAPDAASVVLARDVTLTFDGSNFDPQYVRADLLNMDETPGPIGISMNFKLPLKGSGAAGTAPEFGEILKAWGWPRRPWSRRA